MSLPSFPGLSRGRVRSPNCPIPTLPSRLDDEDQPDNARGRRGKRGGRGRRERKKGKEEKAKEWTEREREEGKKIASWQLNMSRWGEIRLFVTWSRNEGHVCVFFPFLHVLNSSSH